MPSIQSFSKRFRHLSRLQKFFVVGFVFVLLIIVFLLGERVSILSQITRQAQLTPPTPPATFAESITKKEVRKSTMQQILSYIGSQYRADGYYDYLAHYDDQCITKAGKKDCPFNGERMFPTTNAWTALAYLSSYRAFATSQDLDLATRDMDKLMLYCGTNQKECLWVLVQAADLYNVTKQPRLLAFLREEGEELLRTKESDYFMLLAIESRELALLYGLTQDPRYLQQANVRFDHARQRLLAQRSLYHNKQGTAFFPEQGCWYALSAVELARQTSQVSYGDEAQKFLTQAQIYSHFSDFPNPVEIQPCIESYFQLSKLLGDQRYYQYGEGLLKKFVDRFWDGGEVKKKYGEGGTLLNPDPKRSAGGENYVNLTDSAYTAYLLQFINNQ